MVPAAKPVPCSTYATRDHGRCRSRVALCKEGIMEDYLLQGCINHIHGLEGFDHMRMTELEPGHCKVEIDTHQGLQNVYGNMHGGAIMVLVDMVSSTAAFACGKHVITLTSDTNFIKGLKIDGRDVTIVGDVVHNGRTTMVVETKIFDADGRECVRNTSTMYVPREVDPDEEPPIAPLSYDSNFLNGRNPLEENPSM